MRMKSRVVARSPEETEVTVTSDVNVVGVLAQFGRGMIQDVSDQLFERFAVAMRAELEAAAAAPAASASRPAGGAAAASASQGASASQTASAPSAAAAPPAPTAPAAGRDAPAAPAPTAARDPSGSAELAGAPPAPAAAPPPAAAPAGDVLDVGALGAAAAGRAAWRTLRRPGFWISIVLLVLLVYVAFYRH